MLLFFGQICPGADPGRGQNRSRGFPSSKNFVDLTATGTNRMHSSDLEVLGKKCCYFWFHSEGQNRSTEGCSKLKRSVDTTSSGKNGLNIRTNASPKWDIFRVFKVLTRF